MNSDIPVAPRGVFAVVLGVDGSGKSTLVELLRSRYEENGDSVRTRHLRPGFLPPLGWFAGKQVGAAPPVNDPHASVPSGWLGSSFRVLYLLVDYWLGYLIWILPFARWRSGIVLFDRYAYDLLLDPRRFRVNLPGGVLRWVVWVVPAPDLIICLHGAGTDIAARKQELPLNEIDRQLSALNAFVFAHPVAKLVSVSRPVAQVVEEVQGLLDGFSGRHAHPLEGGAARRERGLGWRWLLPDNWAKTLSCSGFPPTQRTSFGEITRSSSVSDGSWEASGWVVKAGTDGGKAARDTLERGNTPEWVAAECEAGDAGRWRRLLSKKFGAVREYALIPATRPRVVVPLTSIRHILAGLSLHRPGSLRARLLMMLARLSARIGWFAPLRRHVLIIGARDPEARSCAALRADLSPEGGDKSIDPALFLGHPLLAEKISLLPIGSSAPTGIVKFATDPEARATIIAEAHLLGQFAASPVGGQVPVVHRISEDTGFSAMIQEYRPRVRISRRRLRSAAADFLTSLSALNRRKVPLAAALGGESGAMKNSQPGNMDAAARRLDDWLWSEAARGAVLSECRCHNDFAPWNVSWTAKGLFVFDWEESEPHGNALADPLYFILGPPMMAGGGFEMGSALRRAFAFASDCGDRFDRTRRSFDLHLAAWVRAHRGRPAFAKLQEYLAKRACDGGFR